MTINPTAMKRKKTTLYGKTITHKWTNDQKLQAVSMYCMVGNLREVARLTDIPEVTLKLWKTKPWFAEYLLQLKNEDIQITDVKLRRIIDKALLALEDRIDMGDAQFDQKTGKITRIPIKANVALKISTELMQRRDNTEKNPSRKEEIEKTIDDRLSKLSQEFARFATAKTIDVEPKEVTPHV